MMAEKEPVTGGIRIEFEESDKWDIAMLKKDMESGALLEKLKGLLSQYHRDGEKEIDIVFEDEAVEEEEEEREEADGEEAEGPYRCSCGSKLHGPCRPPLLRS
jgi:tRNA A37 threonylcarbamoyladenosine dehydratase